MLESYASVKRQQPATANPELGSMHLRGNVNSRTEKKKTAVVKVDQSFPVKLHYMLNDMEQDGLDHIISWQPHGRCFLVHLQTEFVAKVLPLWFRQTKLPSFQRQLNLYGFQRITTGRDKGGYYHSLFLRGKPHLAAHIQRISIKGTKIRLPSSPATEPDFYRIPFLPNNEKRSRNQRNSSSLDNNRNATTRTTNEVLESDEKKKFLCSLIPAQVCPYPTSNLQQVPKSPSSTLPTLSLSSSSDNDRSGPWSLHLVPERSTMKPGHSDFLLDVARALLSGDIEQRLEGRDTFAQESKPTTLLEVRDQGLRSVLPEAEISGSAPGNRHDETCCNATDVLLRPGMMITSPATITTSNVHSPANWTGTGPKRLRRGYQRNEIMLSSSRWLKPLVLEPQTTGSLTDNSNCEGMNSEDLSNTIAAMKHAIQEILFLGPSSSISSPYVPIHQETAFVSQATGPRTSMAEPWCREQEWHDGRKDDTFVNAHQAAKDSLLMESSIYRLLDIIETSRFQAIPCQFGAEQRSQPSLLYRDWIPLNAMNCVAQGNEAPSVDVSQNLFETQQKDCLLSAIEEALLSTEKAQLLPSTETIALVERLIVSRRQQKLAQLDVLYSALG